MKKVASLQYGVIFKGETNKYEEGRQAGWNEEKRRLAHQMMLNRGLEVKLIAKLTHLTLKEIQQLEQAVS